MSKVVLLVNLGSPNSNDVQDVKKYLDQFLMDPDVIDLPWVLRALLVKGLIVPFRSSKTAQAYSAIWTNQGSPLIVNSQLLAEKLQKKVDVPVYFAMRYGRPAIHTTLNEIINQHSHVKTIHIIPLYPHYADSTVGSCKKEIQRAIKKYQVSCSIQIHPPFYNDKQYIDALFQSAKDYLNQSFDHLLFSYHGIPTRHLKKADPTKKHCLTQDCCVSSSHIAHDTCYRHHVMKTTELFVQQAQLQSTQYSVSFQSRLGKAEWLRPYTEDTLIKLAHLKVKKLLVICPSFVTDCLETLEEINIRGREVFQQAGGEEMTMIPCLNTHDRWIEVLANWIK